MGPRRKAREAAVKMLYQVEMTGYDVEDCIAGYWSNLGATDDDELVAFANMLVRGVAAHRDEIDGSITRMAKNWSIDRINKVDLCILRLAIFELLHAGDIPERVTINEAVELAKKFGTENTPSFVNGIVDAVARERR